MANYASIANMGNPANPEWQKSLLETIKAPNGAAWQVNKNAAKAFQGLISDLVAEGYTPTSSGGFNYRTIRGNPNKLSQHAFGTAIDIDAANNPLGSHRTNLPANIADLAARHGLEWGGTWKSRPDPMHFEWKGPSTGENLGTQLPANVPSLVSGSPAPDPGMPAPAFGSFLPDVPPTSSEPSGMSQAIAALLQQNNAEPAPAAPAPVQFAAPQAPTLAQYLAALRQGSAA